LHCLCDILRQLTRREYIKASDAYYRMAIGNAPWPIGVTNVGIHTRTGREKLFSQHIAHVLNDEVQRKYIQVGGMHARVLTNQGLKRLMTYCQKRFPTDPSKCLEYQVGFFIDYSLLTITGGARRSLWRGAGEAIEALQFHIIGLN
jgi:pre-mRNA-splicing factor 18